MNTFLIALVVVLREQIRRMSFLFPIRLDDSLEEHPDVVFFQARVCAEWPAQRFALAVTEDGCIGLQLVEEDGDAFPVHVWHEVNLAAIADLCEEALIRATHVLRQTEWRAANCQTSAAYVRRQPWDEPAQTGEGDIENLLDALEKDKPDEEVAAAAVGMPEPTDYDQPDPVVAEIAKAMVREESVWDLVYSRAGSLVGTEPFETMYADLLEKHKALQQAADALAAL